MSSAQARVWTPEGRVGVGGLVGFVFVSPVVVASVVEGLVRSVGLVDGLEDLELISVMLR